MYYLGTRYYDPYNCRFISVDSALYHNMLGYNLFAYCYNNPVIYVDYTGENPGVAVSGYVFAGAVLIVAGVVAGYLIAEVAIPKMKEENEKLKEFLDVVGIIIKAAAAEAAPPKSVSEEDSKSEGKEKAPSRPGKMQKEVERGQAPKEVDRVHDSHDKKNGKPHIHFKDKTSLNNDGTPHDSHRGTPKLTNSVKKWLIKHNWSIDLFP